MIVLLTILTSLVLASISGFLIEFKYKSSIDERGLDLSIFGAFFGIIGALIVIRMFGNAILLLSRIDVLLILVVGILVGPAILSYIGQFAAIRFKKKRSI